MIRRYLDYTEKEAAKAPGDIQMDIHCRECLLEYPAFKKNNLPCKSQDKHWWVQLDVEVDVLIQQIKERTQKFQRGLL